MLPMLCMDTPYARAIVLQMSPSLTTYSIGGRGVAVGAAVGSMVGEGVIVNVGVRVTVGVMVGVVTRPVVCRMTKIKAAPSPRMTTARAIAAGRLTFNSGNLGVCTGVAVSFFATTVNVRPHTRQRVAFSLSLVPQVGQLLG